MGATRLPRGSVEGSAEARQKRLPEREPGSDWGALLRAYLDSHRASLADSLRRLAAQPFGSFLTCLAMGIALALPMGLALLLDNVERLGGSWQRAAQISVFLRLELPEAEGLALRERIAALDTVLSAEWIGPAQALESLQQHSGLGDALRELPENPLPAVVLVTPQEIDKPALEALRARLAVLPGVEQAQLDLLWVERLGAILHLGERFVFGLAVTLVLALLLVIGNTIRLHIENRRAEIEVIKLVGGTDGYVRRPFLYSGALYGGGAGLVAWGGLEVGLGWLNQSVVGLSGLYGSDFALAGVPLADGLSLLAGALLLGWVGAWLAVARHLRALAPQ